MKIAIVGAGAIGSLLSGYLSLQHEVTCIVRRPEHAIDINENGIRIIDGTKEILAHPTAVTDAKQVGTVDLILVCVKSTQTETAMRSHRSLAGKDTLILSIQNGYGNHEDLMSIFSKEQIIMGTTSNGAHIEAPGTVIFAGHGETQLGGLLEDQSGAEKVAEVLRTSGFPAVVTENVMEAIWRKLLINVGINPVAALCRAPNKYIVENPGANKSARLLVSEAVVIAKAYGVSVEEEEIIKSVEAVARNTGNNLCSMLQDLNNHRPTEINKINGAIVMLAKRIGMSAPLNEKITEMVTFRQMLYLAEKN